MKKFALKKMKTFLITSLSVLSVMFGATALATLAPQSVNGQAETLASTVFQTDGASVRVFKKTAEGYEETDRKGIRFHIEMGADYEVAENTLLLDTTVTNANGSYKMAEGYKSYTLILPTRLMDSGSDLTMTTDKVMKIDTSGYWFSDNDQNWESVAYIYNIPAQWYTDEFSYRGVIVSVAEDGTETPVKWTTTSTRTLTGVAKLAYADTIDENTYYWGSQENDDKAAPIIKDFIPTYTLTYQYYNDAGELTTTTEEVLWGDTPQSVPTVEAKSDEHIEYEVVWYDEASHETIDVSSVLTWTENKTITISSTTSTEFALTGVADYNNFTSADTTYSGVKIYATLPTSDFYTADEIASGTTKMVELAVEAVDIEYSGTGTFGGLQGAWTLLEGNGGGAQMRLILAFDSGTLENGDKLVVKSTSMLYAHNIMYKLTEDYTIDYTISGAEEDYGMFLGYLHNSDIKSIENWIEPTDKTRKRIRITFYENLLINSDFKFVYDGTLPEGYEYPVYTQCNENDELPVYTEIAQGYYYWNEGEHTILELEGYAYHNNDELYSAPGVKIVQNGGYYIYEDAMYAYYNGTNWVVGAEKGTFGADAFETRGVNFTDGTEEVRFTTNSNTTLTADGSTTDRWFDKVLTLYVENMSEEPYAVYATAPDGTVTEISSFMYHGQTTDTAYNHIFAFKGYFGTQAGETVTIVEGARFWYGSEYYTATETIVFYFNGNCWVANHKGEADSTISASNFSGMNYNYTEADEIYKMRMHLTAEEFNGGTGALYVENGSVRVNGEAYTNLKYHGNGNKIFELIGKGFAEEGAQAIGSNAFIDTLVIEKGTRLWIGVNKGDSATPYCLEFTETIEWRYIGEKLRDSGGNLIKYDWVVANNTDITVDDVLSMLNATDAGGEVRLKLADGILTNDFYGYMAVNASKGLPIINGVEFSDTAFAYNQSNDLIAVRGGKYGTEIGDYIIIPAGSMWWTTQGSLTFTEEIRGVWGGSGWFYGFNSNIDLGAIDGDVLAVVNDGANEIRVKIPLDIYDTYYGAIVIDGDAYVTKADGTLVKSAFGYWYGGESTSYTADHSLIGFRATGIAGASDGDVLTIKGDTKIIFKTALGVKGYTTFGEDVVYTYVDGSWKVGNLNTTATYSANNASVFGETKLIIGKTYTFTVTPDSGYTVSNVTVNGGALEINASNTYSFVAETTNEILVETVEGFVVTFEIANATVAGGAITDGMLKAVPQGDSFTFTVTANDGYRIGEVTNATDNRDGTYTVTPTADVVVTINTVKQWTLTYSLTNATATIAQLDGQTLSGTGSVVVDEGAYAVTLTPNSGYGISSVTGLTDNGDGTHTVTVNGNVTVSVVAAQYTVTVSATGATVSGVTNGQTVAHGEKLTLSVSAEDGYTNATLAVNGATDNGDGTYTVTGDVTITATATESCVVEGTMIMLADGTQKPVEELKTGDMVLVFNHYDCTLDVSQIVLNAHANQNEALYRILNLKFSNGVIERVVGIHGFFDVTLNEYIMISEDNIKDFIGHEFYYVNDKVESHVKLIEYYITEEIVRIYSPVTLKYANYFADGILNAPPLPGTKTSGHMNHFDFDENMKYDEIQMQDDIAKYGLYTYEEFQNYISKEIFELWPIQYFKISVGKGLMTYEDVLRLCEYIRSLM